MKLIVGLGNPGPEYERTRHNVGFQVIDRLARRFADPATSVPRAKFSGLLVECEIGGEKVLLLRPTVFMNLSGTSVAEATRFYKLDPARDVLVLVDDLALPCGSIRVRGEGGTGGHNGLSDIRPETRKRNVGQMSDRNRPTRQNPAEIIRARSFHPRAGISAGTGLEDAVKASACWVTEGLVETMNRFNRRETPVKTNDE